MRIFQGQYGSSTLSENNLAQNQLMYPQISKKMILEYPQYSLTYFTEGLGRYAKEVIIGDKQFKWWIRGRLSRALTATGTVSGTGAGHTVFTVEFLENHANPNEIIKFKNGEAAIITGEPIQSAGGWTYSMILQTTSTTATITASNYTNGVQCGITGNAHIEGSEKGYGNLVFPDQYTNYLAIARAGGDITGSALTDITWIESGGQRLWYWTEEEQIKEQFFYRLELSRWYHKCNMDANGNPLVFIGGKPIVTGDGLLAQIDGGNVAAYVPGLTERQITNFLADLRYTNGQKTANYIVHTGTAGRREFQQAMKDYYIGNGVLFYDADAGGTIKLGGDFMSYRAMGLTMTLVHNILFDDPTIHLDLAPDGYPKESYKMVFTNFDMLPDGVSNLETLVKGAEGMNRGYIVKYIAGMVNPFNQKEILASNSKDAFGVEYLSESGIILRRPKSCGILQY